MDVRLYLLGRLQLNDQIHIGNIQSSAGYISCYQNSELSFLEPLHGQLSLKLSDVSMHGLAGHLELVRETERVSISLGLSEDDGLAFSAIACHYD